MLCYNATSNIPDSYQPSLGSPALAVPPWQSHRQHQQPHRATQPLAHELIHIQPRSWGAVAPWPPKFRRPWSR